jgi:quinolinate synthase
MQAEIKQTPVEAARERLASVFPADHWDLVADDIEAIERLKRERNAVVLAHNYMTPDIYHGVADIVGDSLALARQACKTDADVVVVAGVHFMAETAKIVNPDKTVLMPDPRAGCSLASSITAEDVRAMRRAHPGVPVVAYVNTSAAVKAEVDVCCTSGNAIEVVRSLNAERVIMLPDKYLADWVRQATGLDIIVWEGSCEVHERFTADEIAGFRKAEKNLTVIAHPECPPDVLGASDYVGSTAGMIDYLADRRPERVLLLTECSMSDNVAGEYKDIDFVRTCNLCPHMKMITLENIRRSLETLSPEVIVDTETADRARRSVERMLEVV